MATLIVHIVVANSRKLSNCSVVSKLILAEHEKFYVIL